MFSHKNKLFIRSICILLFIYGLTSCSDGVYYQKTYDFKNRVWTNKQSIPFKINIDDTTSVYRFELTVRTTTEYSYSNLWLIWKSKTPINERASEPFELKIADAQGYWLGKKSGSILSNNLTFLDRKMPYLGEYVFTIQQASTVSELKEVLDIGLKVYKVNENVSSQRKNLSTEKIDINEIKNIKK